MQKKKPQPLRQILLQSFGDDGQLQLWAVAVCHLREPLLQSLAGILQGKVQNRTLPGRKAEKRLPHAHPVGHLQNEKGLADLWRAGEEISPRRQQSFNDRGTKRKSRFHQLRHGHHPHLAKLLVRFFKSWYTIRACKRGRLLPIWCNRWNRGSRFFFSCHSHLPYSARSSR